MPLKAKYMWMAPCDGDEIKSIPKGKLPAEATNCLIWTKSKENLFELMILTVCDSPTDPGFSSPLSHLGFICGFVLTWHTQHSSRSLLYASTPLWNLIEGADPMLRCVGCCGHLPFLASRQSAISASCGPAWRWNHIKPLVGLTSDFPV